MDRKQGEPEVKLNVLSGPAAAPRADVRPNRLTRAVGRSVRAAALPGVSARSTGVVLVVCLGLAAVALPLFLHRSAWVEAEIVLLAWFVIWTAVLAWLGYAGRPLVDDGPVPVPWGRSARTAGGQPGAGPAGFASSVPLDGLGDGFSLDLGDGDDLAGAIVALILLVVAAVLLAVVAAVVLPLLLALLYGAVRLMLGRVADEPDATRGRLVASVGRGALWAAVFTGPLALTVWLIHVVL